MLDTNVVAQAGAGVLDATIKIVLQENGVEVAPDWYLIDTPFVRGISDGITIIKDIVTTKEESNEEQNKK